MILIKNIADVKNKDIKKITACLIDRPRHKSIIEELIRLNVNLKLITISLFQRLL